jgi:hypothetical protein
MMEAAMYDYRLYFLDGDGYFCGVRVLACTDEAEAITAFERDASDRPMELWCSDRCLKTYSPVGGGQGTWVG